MTRNCPKRHWDVDDVRALGVATDIETAGAVLGIGRGLAYRLAKEDQFPVPVISPGNRLIVPVSGLLKVLGC